jgi:hypothetical protein
MIRQRPSIRYVFALQCIVAAFFCLHPRAMGAAQSPAATPSSSASQNTSQTPATTAPGTADAAGSTANPPAPKTKKVWTNEDVSGLGGTISVVGDARNGKSKTIAQGAPDAQYINTARKQLEKLRGQMAAADKEIASLKDFAAGEPVSTSDREFHKNYGNQPIQQQIEGLQAKKKDLQSQIDALLDEARKKGVEPGQLRQ